MFKRIAVLVLVFWSIFSSAQNNFSEQFPVFPNCEGKQLSELETCFYNEVQTFVFQNYQVPDKFKDQKTTVIVLFEVDDKGSFKVQYVDAIDETLTAESKRVFSKLPKWKCMSPTAV